MFTSVFTKKDLNCTKFLRCIPLPLPPPSPPNSVTLHGLVFLFGLLLAMFEAFHFTFTVIEEGEAEYEEESFEIFVAEEETVVE